jgi:hypothetical protein
MADCRFARLAASRGKTFVAILDSGADSSAPWLQLNRGSIRGSFRASTGCFETTDLGQGFARKNGKILRFASLG